MADPTPDLAAQLAAAITRAATRSAAQHSTWTVAMATEKLAADLRRIFDAELPSWYAGYQAAMTDAADRDYSVEEYHADERHRHSMGGRTWEHAHRDGHDVHSAVGHDMAGARLVADHRVPAGGWVGVCEECGDVGPLWRYGSGGDGQACWRCAGKPSGPPSFPEARPEPPTALSGQAKRDAEALDRIAALLRSGADLDGSDAGDGVAEIVRATGRAVDSTTGFCGDRPVDLLDPRFSDYGSPRGPVEL